MVVTIEEISKFAFAQPVEKTGRVTTSPFPVSPIETVAYRIHTVLTDNGIQFRSPSPCANGLTARYMNHMLDMRCRENDIEHRFTQINRPWANGPVERMNRTVRTPPSSASATMIATSSDGTWPTSLTPATLTDG